MSSIVLGTMGGDLEVRLPANAERVTVGVVKRLLATGYGKVEAYIDVFDMGSTSDRPLSDDAEALSRRLFASFRVPTVGTISIGKRAMFEGVTHLHEGVEEPLPLQGRVTSTENGKRVSYEVGAFDVRVHVCGMRKKIQCTPLRLTSISWTDANGTLASTFTMTDPLCNRMKPLFELVCYTCTDSDGEKASWMTSRLVDGDHVMCVAGKLSTTPGQSAETTIGTSTSVGVWLKDGTLSSTYANGVRPKFDKRGQLQWVAYRHGMVVPGFQTPKEAAMMVDLISFYMHTTSSRLSSVDWNEEEPHPGVLSASQSWGSLLRLSQVASLLKITSTPTTKSAAKHYEFALRVRVETLAHGLQSLDDPSRQQHESELQLFLQNIPSEPALLSTSLLWAVSQCRVLLRVMSQCADAMGGIVTRAVESLQDFSRQGYAVTDPLLVRFRQSGHFELVCVDFLTDKCLRIQGIPVFYKRQHFICDLRDVVVVALVRFIPESTPKRRRK